MALGNISLPLISRYIGTLKTLVSEPVGLYVKSRTYLYSNIVRNAGGLYDYGTDSWGTPIGELSIPDYVERVGNATYLNDNTRDSYPNYINYIRNTFGNTIGVDNINEKVYIRGDKPSSAPLEHLSVADEEVVRIVSYGGEFISPVIHNLSYGPEDTIMGKISASKLGENISTALSVNNDRVKPNHSISKAINANFGMIDAAYVGKNGIGFKLAGGYSSDNNIYLNGVDVGPVYNNKTNGLTYHGSDLSNLTYIDTLSDFQKDNLTRNTSELKYKIAKGETYLDKVGIHVSEYGIKLDDKLPEYQVRYIFESSVKTQTTSSTGSPITYVYGEMEGSAPDQGSPKTGFEWFGDGSSMSLNGVIKYTNDMFRNGKYGTLISRFHTDGGSKEFENDPTQTAFSQYGASHGRNLLRKKHKENDPSSTYDNPYCRVWTNHHQYHRFADLIRPFSESSDSQTYTLVSPYTLDTENNYLRFRSPDTGMDGGSGGGRLTKHGVINYNTNGLVNITPVNDGNDKHKVDIKNCMFSIENLAWKGAFSNTGGADGTSQNIGLSKEQKGPFGGRIMWFPPYGITINEQSEVDWNSTDFIGRGESIYTYSNTKRTGNLSFILLIDHPSIINYWKGRKDNSENSGVDNVESSEQTLLRFFAGCDRLSASNAEAPKRPKAPEPKENVVEPLPETKTMTFFVFFPNNYTGKDDDPQTAMTYLMNGIGAGKTGSTNGPDFITMNKILLGDGQQIGGYEVRQSTVSVRTSELNSASGFIGAAYVNSVESLNHRSYYVISGKGTTDFSNKSEWYKAKWAYRVDTDPDFVIDEVLHAPEHYVDTKSNGLNSGNQVDTIKKAFNVGNDDKLFAATDVFTALEGAKAESLLSSWYNAANVKEFLDTIKPNIVSIECNGWASSNGAITKNKKLAQRRANTVSNWLKSKLSGNITIKAKNTEVQVGPVVSDISGLDQKLYRCVQVDIHYQVSKAVTSQNATKVTDTTAKKVNRSSTTQYVTIQASNVEGANTTLNNQAESVNSQGWAQDLSNKIENGYNAQSNKSNALAGAKLNTEKNTENVDNTDIAEDETLNRYDNEAEFFSLLEANDPFIHSKITDKIKYFDPAFHSISPEGFNARLTFLHQCTRQGPTVGGSDVYGGVNTANNLAFGRPPVCILRIGDFYYTKIIINNVNMEYEPLVWDLNTEGIGVMPMMAKITINFVFIGGSSLAGPISRLQNALSFNMYANTEVYDNRAEQADFNDNGEISKFKAFVPK